MLHEQIREARIRQGLSQMKLAQLARVPRSQLRKFENGEGGITMTTFLKILGQLPDLEQLTIGPTELRLQHVHFDAMRDKLTELIAEATGILAVLQSVRSASGTPPAPAAIRQQPTTAERQRAEQLNAIAMELAKGGKGPEQS